MPSAKVPRYLFFKPRNLAYVRVNGKTRYLPGKFNSPESLEAYRRLLEELKVTPGGNLPALTRDKRITVTEVCAAFLDFAQGYYVKDGKPTTHMGNIRRALRLLKELYGHAAALEFGPLGLRAIQQRLLDSQANYSRKTINETTSRIKAIFKWATSLELVPPTVYSALTTVEGLKKGRSKAKELPPVGPVSDRIIELTLPQLPQVLADMVRLQRLLGCRPGEVCSMRPTDIDRTHEVWEYRPQSHKAQHHDRDRVIFVGPQAQAILSPYLLRDPDAWCFSPMESEAKRHEAMRAIRKSPVQPSQRSRRKRGPKVKPKQFYTKDSYARAVRRAVEKANRETEEQGEKQGLTPEQLKPHLVPRWKPNQLRHSRATEVRKQFGLEASRTILGHASANTSEIYAERDETLAADVMKKIG